MWIGATSLPTYPERRRTHGQVGYDKWKYTSHCTILLAVTFAYSVDVGNSHSLFPRRCNSLWWCSLGGWCVDTSFPHCHLLCPGYCRHHLCCGMPHVQLHLQEQKVCCYKCLLMYQFWLPNGGNYRQFNVKFVFLVDTLLPTCIIFALFSLRLIRLSSYNLNYLIGCGAVILYMDIYFYIIPTTDPQAVAALCNVC